MGMGKAVMFYVRFPPYVSLLNIYRDVILLLSRLCDLLGLCAKIRKNAFSTDGFLKQFQKHGSLLRALGFIIKKNMERFLVRTGTSKDTLKLLFVCLVPTMMILSCG